MDDFKAKLAEELRYGSVSSSPWQSYTWKNELAKQRNRINEHLQEIFDDVETDYSPHHMIERAVGISAVCMRRLIECRLVTDRFRDSQLDVFEVHRKTDTEWREPFINKTASETFRNFDMGARHSARRSPKQISSKILHARVIGVLSGSEYLPDGLLIASDTQHKQNLFHFTPTELSTLFDAFLNDFVRFEQDGFVKVDGVIQTDKVYATRE